MFRTIVHIVVILALSVLIGGILFFGAGVASLLFKPGILPSRTLAGAVNAAILHRLNVIQGVCAAILPIALAWLSFSTPRSASRITFGLSILMLGVTLYMGIKLFPEINALRLEIGDFDHLLAMKEPLLDRFHQLHTLYSRLAQGTLITSVVILIIHVSILSRFRKLVPSKGSIHSPSGKTKGGEQKKVEAKVSVAPEVSTPQNISGKESEQTSSTEEPPIKADRTDRTEGKEKKDSSTSSTRSVGIEVKVEKSGVQSPNIDGQTDGKGTPKKSA